MYAVKAIPISIWQAFNQSVNKMQREFDLRTDSL